jgi:hypothetical protein
MRAVIQLFWQISGDGSGVHSACREKYEWFLVCTGTSSLPSQGQV